MSGGLRFFLIEGAALLLVLALAACGGHVAPSLERPPQATVVTTGGPNPSPSMSHLARVEGGVIAIDLGWWGAAEALQEGLAELGAGPEDVIAVFVTHAHRDHIGGWRAVREAAFYMAEPEVVLFFGEREHGGWIPRWADRIRRPDLPRRGEVDVRSFPSDTAVAFGADTVHAYHVPGHTEGSTVYLFRGVLFAGDAVAHTPGAGYQRARRGYSDDVDEARRQLHLLRWKLRDREVEWICTAHAECTEVDEAFWKELLESP